MNILFAIIGLVIGGTIATLITTINFCMTCKKIKEESTSTYRKMLDMNKQAYEDRIKTLSEANKRLKNQMEEYILRPNVIEVERPDIITLESCKMIDEKQKEFIGEDKVLDIVKREMATDFIDKIMKEIEIRTDNDIRSMREVYCSRIRIVKGR